MVDGLAVTVLLRHDLPDGGSHFDWLLERPGSPTGALISFRVQARIDQLESGSFDAVRIGDHRREYLEYEGPISGGRGGVTRVARGTCRVLEEAAAMVVEGDFGSGPRVLRGREGAGGVWTFEIRLDSGLG